MESSDDDLPIPPDSTTSIRDATTEVIRIALPLMISAGMFSLTLFTDRVLLLKFDGPAMSASMAGGNLFWVIVCLPVGIASMTGAIVSQYVGAGEEHRVGRFLWQSVWLSLMTAPCFVGFAVVAPDLFRLTGQPSELLALETTYLRLLMFGAVGLVLENALSGFFSGTERTRTIMSISIVAAVVNIALDVLLIFGTESILPDAVAIPALGIGGAAIASSLSFWFKAACYASLLVRRRYEETYRTISGFGLDGSLIGKLLYFGLPTGLMYVTESGGFTAIVLKIGQLGDVPLRATTMAINFNMIAFIPLVGVSIAASVLVGRHLLESGPARAAQSAIASLAIGMVYASVWVVAYVAVPDWMMSLYQFSGTDAESSLAIELGQGLLGFVAIYIVLDTSQLILAGILRGAGDTWYVLGSGVLASAIALAIGVVGEPDTGVRPSTLSSNHVGLHWWWWIITLWIGLLALFMAARYVQGSWKSMRMV